MAITKISSALIGANTIATANIADNAIDGTKIAQNSILTKHIDDAQVTADQLAADAVVTAKILDSNVTTAKIADDAVTLAKLAGLARGKIIYGDSSGNPAALALGSNGQVLKSDGTDIAWATDATVAALTSEEVQDIAGAMFSSNTETGITATYQDADGTIDLVVGTLNQDTTGTAATVTTAAQPNITSLGTLTTLTVDDITINGSTISDGADLTLDVEGDIIFDANGGDIRFKDAGTAVAVFENDSLDFKIVNSTQDKDIIFRGNDGGSGVDALTLDMSEAGAAYFNGNVGIGTTSPDRLLDVSGTGNVYGKFQSTNASGAGIEVKDTGEDWLIQADDGTGSGGLAFYDLGRSAYRMFLNASGNFGIGTTSPTTQLTASKSANISQVALTSSSNAVAWDATAAANAYHVTTENTTFSAPSNAVEGAIISVELAQGGTARTIGWNTVFEFAASTAPTVTATASKTDIFSFRYNGSVWQEIGRVQNMAQT